MSSQHTQHPGLCDPQQAVAIHLPPRPRWLEVGSLLRRRATVILVSAAAGFVLGWLARM
jgi:hypothetical protein